MNNIIDIVCVRYFSNIILLRIVITYYIVLVILCIIVNSEWILTQIIVVNCVLNEHKLYIGWTNFSQQKKTLSFEAVV